MDLRVVFLIIALASVGLLVLIVGNRGRWLGSVLLVLSLGWGGFIVWRSIRYDGEFGKIQIGSTSEHIQRLLGSPSRTTDCSTTFGGYTRTQYDRATPGCATEYWYYANWAPEAWSYTFDDKGILIDKYHWVSP